MEGTAFPSQVEPPQTMDDDDRKRSRKSEIEAQIFGDSDEDGGLSELEDLARVSDEEDYNRGADRDDNRRDTLKRPYRDDERDRRDRDRDRRQRSPSAADSDDDHRTSSSSKSRLPKFNKRSKSLEADDRDQEHIRIQKKAKPRALSRRGKDRRDVDDDRDDEPREILSPEEERKREIREDIDKLFKEALSGGKTKRRKKEDEDELDRNLDDMMVKLVQRMKEAAELDFDANEVKRPSIAKLKMLPAVLVHLNKSNLYGQFLENNILSAIKRWLEPLPDGSLPSLDIQTEMMTTLSKMPIETDHLRESGIGKVIAFYTKCDRIEPRIRKMAEQLVLKWSRPIIKRTENYKDKRLPRIDYVVDEHGTPVSKSKPDDYPDEEIEETNKQDDSAFVRIPYVTKLTYDIVPQSTFHIDTSKSKENDRYKRLKSRMQSLKAGPKKVGPKVSIEGRNMGY